MQDAQWYYAVGHESRGPVDLAGLQRLQQQGDVVASTLLWCDGMDRWQPLHTLQPRAEPLDSVPPPITLQPLPVALEPLPLALAPQAAGAESEQPDNPYGAPATVTAAPLILPLGAGLEGDLGRFAAVVGGNFPSYRQQWRLDQGSPSAAGTWHWAGFFLGSTWFAYRRLYRPLAISVGLLLVGLMVDLLLRTGGVLFCLALLAVAIMGGRGYRTYLAHCQRELARAQALHPQDGDALRRELSRRGGTTVPATAVTLCAVWLLFSAAASLLGVG